MRHPPGKLVRPLVHWLVVAVAVGYLGWTAPHLVGQAGQAVALLGRLRWEWLVTAVLAGTLALVVYGELHRQLLLVGGARVPAATVQGINFVENAVSITVPVVGGAGALAYAIDQLRRRRVDPALASWSVLVAGVIATVMLLLLGVVGLAASGRIPLGLGLLLAGLIVVGSAGGWKTVSRPGVLRRLVRALLLLGRWVPGLCRDCRTAWALRADQVSGRLSSRLALLRPSAARWSVLLTLAAVPWALDFGCLVASVMAVDSRVPWGVLLVGFLLVQASVAVQILPGGAGLAETSLLALLLGSGVAPAAAAASVLIYRSITWLGMALVGWAIYALSLHTSPPHVHRHAPEVIENRNGESPTTRNAAWPRAR